MKQLWSARWKASAQPRKQRKFRHMAPLHARRKFVSANLHPILRKDYGKRSMPIRKGDEVEVMRGGFRKLRGVVERVDLKKGRIFVENIKVKKVDGSEVLKALEPSNLRITKMGLDDKRRQRVLERSPGREKKPEKAAKPEKPPKPGKPAGKREKPPEKPPKAPERGPKNELEGMPKKEHSPKKGTKDGM